MISISEYRENARSNNLCSEYSLLWDKCKSNKQLFDMGMSGKGVDYLCDTIAKGWGISPEVISDKFKSFINGRYVSHQKGYDSEMYCLYKGHVEANKTLTAIISSDVDICIPKNEIVEIYVTGRSSLKVSGEGRCVFICYGNPSDIVITGQCENMKRINKDNRDDYGK